jgi:hypothetical protein
MVTDDDAESGPQQPPISPPALMVSEHRSLPRITPSQLWELIWRPSVQRVWLGEESFVTLHTRQRFSLNFGGSLWRIGRVLLAVPGTFQAEVTDLPGTVTTELVVSITQYGTGCGLSISETGFANEANRQEAELYWRAALQRLVAVAVAADSRSRNPRQAVILIHGIGEQRPGRTLRDFVAAGTLGASKDTQVRPDRGSRLFDLRRITMRPQPNQSLPTTDVFELYWAHLIRDTTTQQVVTWVRRLLFRTDVPQPLRPAWRIARALAAIVAVLFLAQFALQSALITLGSVLLLALATVGLGWRLAVRPLAINWIGDAARYLVPEPDNIAHRQEIRQEGVDLLARLHEGGNYDRIVVVGHSLGSVIAYDIVTNAWVRMHSAHRSPINGKFTQTRALERAIADPNITAVEAQDLQYNAWREQRLNTHPWLVTDLITVGSPLTYGAFLMSDSEEAFTTAQENRVLPTCPPQTSEERKSHHARCTFELPYTDAVGRHRTFTVFDHGAPFAVTRWTNLYFPARWGGLKGDLVGGPIHGSFGRWILDVPLSGVHGAAHTSYWKPPEFGDDPPEGGPRPAGSAGIARRDRARRLTQTEMNHLAALRIAIWPWYRTELLAVGRELPRWLWPENRREPR